MTSEVSAPPAVRRVGSVWTPLDLAGLDPRAKLVATVVLGLPLLARPSEGVVGAYLLVLGLGALAGGQVRDLCRGLVPLLWLALGLVAFSALATPEGRVWLVGVLPFSAEGAARGAVYGLRMVELVALGLLLAATTPPLRMAAGLEWLLQPLRWLRVDVSALSLVALLVLRFVPLFKAELATTERAMFLRGARFGRGPVDQLRRLSALAVPAIGRLLVAADDLAAALVSRGYGLGGLATHAELRFGRRDALLLGASVALAATMLLA